MDRLALGLTFMCSRVLESHLAGEDFCAAECDNLVSVVSGELEVGCSCRFPGRNYGIGCSQAEQVTMGTGGGGTCWESCEGNDLPSHLLFPFHFCLYQQWGSAGQIGPWNVSCNFRSQLSKIKKEMCTVPQKGRFVPDTWRCSWLQN